MSLMALFGALILIALVVWAVPKVLGAIGVPPNVATIIYVLMVCLIVLWLVSVVFGVGPWIRLR
jgi:choline-glycine betaine transporter